MTATEAPPSPESPPLRVEVDQAERYRFEVSYPGTGLRPLTVDEPAPVGAGAGPDPALALAGAVGHCLSSTLFNTLERSHVRATPIRTTVTITFGRNAAGRKRVVGLEVQIECAPLNESDRERFDRSVAIFEDYCTVTGSVREGIRVRTHTHPPAGSGPAELRR
jgi:organic hydroperoxide reductase OsmC/OhrA